MNKLGMQAVKDGLANLHVCEDPKGSNRGKWIDTYNTFAGAPLGSSWCCSFLVYRVYQAADALKISCPIPKTPYVPALYAWGKQHGRACDTPQPGMAFVEYFPELNGYHHTGLVASASGISFTTVEGNSNNDGSREGYEVASNTRTLQPGRYKFISLEP
jgi:hypothetical protein